MTKDEVLELAFTALKGAVVLLNQMGQHRDCIEPNKAILAILAIKKLQQEQVEFISGEALPRCKECGDAIFFNKQYNYEKILTAVTVLLNVAAFGSTSKYEDGSPTPNRLLQIESAKYLHSLVSNQEFEVEHGFLLNYSATVDDIKYCGKYKLAQLEHERIKAFLNKHKASALPDGACECCKGEGEIGGQFCGGFQECPDCNGTGKATTNKVETELQKMVPVNPTLAMYEAARNNCADYDFEVAREIYRAMLAAAPTPPDVK
jgi:hypothetical protein